MSVREAVDTTSKAFATGGEDFAYYPQRVPRCG